MTYNATMLKGWGYWDTTHYPRGGCFKRSTEDVRCTITGKAGHEITVVFGDGRKACCDPRGIRKDETAQ